MKFARKGERVVRIADNDVKAYEGMGYQIADTYAAPVAKKPKRKETPEEAPEEKEG